MLRLIACWISFDPVWQLSEICICELFVKETNGCWRWPTFYANSHGGHGTVTGTGSKYFYLEGIWFSAIKITRICCLSHLVVPSSLLGLRFLTIKDSCLDTQFPTGLPMPGLGEYNTVTETQGLRWKILNPNPSRHVDLMNSDMTGCVLTVSVLRQRQGWTGGTKDSLLPEATAWDERHTLRVLWVATTHFSVNNGFQSLYCHSHSHVKTALSWISLHISLVNSKSTECPSCALPPLKC